MRHPGAGGSSATSGGSSASGSRLGGGAAGGFIYNGQAWGGTAERARAAAGSAAPGAPAAARLLPAVPAGSSGSGGSGGGIVSSTLGACCSEATTTPVPATATGSFHAYFPISEGHPMPRTILLFPLVLTPVLFATSCGNDFTPATKTARRAAIASNSTCNPGLSCGQDLRRSRGAGYAPKTRRTAAALVSYWRQMT